MAFSLTWNHFFDIISQVKAEHNSFFWYSREQKKTTGQTEGFDLKHGWIFLQGVVLFLSCVHMWTLNGKSNQWYIAHLLRAHTQGCAWETAKTFSGHLWMRVKREWKFRDSGRPAVALQARSPYWHAPTTGMQPVSELSALASSS